MQKPRRTAATLLLIVQMMGCMKWQERAIEPAPADPLRGDVRVMLHDGRRLVLRDPALVGDSLIGLAGVPRQRTSIALGAIARLEGQVTDGWRTAAVVLGGVAVVAFAVAAIAPLADMWCTTRYDGTKVCPE